jgi:hypothetical protein
MDFTGDDPCPRRDAGDGMMGVGDYSGVSPNGGHLSHTSSIDGRTLPDSPTPAGDSFDATAAGTPSAVAKPKLALKKGGMLDLLSQKLQLKQEAELETQSMESANSGPNSMGLAGDGGANMGTSGASKRKPKLVVRSGEADVRAALDAVTANGHALDDDDWGKYDEEDNSFNDDLEPEALVIEPRAPEDDFELDAPSFGKVLMCVKNSTTEWGADASRYSDFDSPSYTSHNTSTNEVASRIPDSWFVMDVSVRVCTRSSTCSLYFRARYDLMSRKLSKRRRRIVTL